MFLGFDSRARSALVTFLVAAASAAQPSAGAVGIAADDPSLARLVREALQARPELAQAEASTRAARAGVPQATALPDPMLQVGLQNDGFTALQVGQMETSWWQIVATQTIPWPARLKLRGQLAELGADEAVQRLARARLSTEADVRRAYVDLCLARDRLTSIDALDSLWKRSADAARARYEVGQATQAELLGAQLQLNRLRQRRIALRADEANAIAALNRLRGKPSTEELGPTPSLAEVTPSEPAGDVEAIAADAVSRSPEIVAASIALREAERSVELARAAFIPDLSVSAGVMPRGGRFEPMWQLGVAATLPVFAAQKQAKAVDEALARVDAARSARAELEQSLRLRTSQRHRALTALSETIALYRGGLLVEAGAVAESTLAQYEVGRASFAAVLEANAGVVNDRLAYLEAIADAERIAISERELSLDPPTVSPAPRAPGAAPTGM